ncbi:uncharacterized protein BJX67DRAFT_94216 [Aspergillus lucknowensis]|uniref:Uncharacterized protein n=1 Tax=Aspergillus lucknowensis TaxID=176173 RepID=A0ABR4M5R0_9EURO
MDSPSSSRSSPSKALNPLSPERMNQQTLPNSPSSVTEVLRLQSKGRGLSDVQAKVAYLNGLSRSGSPGAAGSTSAGGAAALQRAILGREEAETALSRVSAQLSESQSRERRISERLESLLEELQTAKERQAHERIVFEKEIRKARKEAFRAGSTLVKIQEELKHTKAESRGLKEEVQSEREGKEKAKQESFERAYAIAGLTEELEELKGRLRTAEANLQSQAQEISRQNEKLSQTKGNPAATKTPTPRGSKRPAADETSPSPPKSIDPTSHQDTPPKKLRLSDPAPYREGQEYDEVPPLTVQELIENLEDDLMFEKRRRINAEETIEFMKVQCMFRACSCRTIEEQENEARAKKQAKAAQQQLSEAKTEELEHVKSETIYSEKNASQQASKEPPEIESREKKAQTEKSIKDAPQEGTKVENQEKIQEEMSEEIPEEIQEVLGEESQETLITFSPATGTFHTIPSPARSSPLKQTQDVVGHQLQPSAARSQSELKIQAGSVSPTPKYESHPHEIPYEPIPQSQAYSRDLTPGAHNSPMIAEEQWRLDYPTGENVDNANEISHVKTIPLRDEDDSSNHFGTAPGTPVSREQALAQIRARRGRASAMKRSVSANDAGFRAGGLNITPVRVARRIPGVQHSDPRGDGVKKTRRDMSAPMRIYR